MNTDTLAHNIRGWVHYDNMIAALQKQITNARKQRDTFEEYVQALLTQNNMLNAIIQISGGQLQIQEEKVTAALTLKTLQESVSSFFKNHPDIPNGEKLSIELMNHLKQQRVVNTNSRLKKLKVDTKQ